MPFLNNFNFSKYPGSFHLEEFLNSLHSDDQSWQPCLFHSCVFQPPSSSPSWGHQWWSQSSARSPWPPVCSPWSAATASPGLSSGPPAPSLWLTSGNLWKKSDKNFSLWTQYYPHNIIHTIYILQTTAHNTMHKKNDKLRAFILFSFGFILNLKVGMILVVDKITK